MADPHVVRQSADILLKWTALALRGALIQRFALDLPDIVGALPTELPVLEVRTEYADQVFQLADDRILHLEFQMIKRPDDLERFLTYALTLYRRYQRKIVSVIFYGPGIHAAPSDLDGGAFVYHAQVVFLGDLRGEEVLRRLSATMDRGERLTPSDRVDMILLPLMAHTRLLVDVLRDAVRLAPALAEEERTATLGAMVGIAYNKLGDEMTRSLLEEPEMSTVLEALVERGYVQGKAEGMAEGKRELVRTLASLRFGAVPAVLEQQISTADAPTLDALFARVEAAQRVEDI